ncbi:uncharacterized protein LOC142332120 [Lycorma delicatula]|uniref:uncharacterized protein LOC142332120 n=1 Tax=Lycorma delicatula TaxID=130591 RepID=UPI003F5180EB
MQAFTDVPVQCCDCKKTFLSASSLLQHFAHHVKIKLVKTNYEKLKLINKNSTFLHKRHSISNNNYKKINNNKISPINNDKQFNNNFYNSPMSSSSSTDNSLQSIISDKSENNSNSEVFVENYNNNNNNNGINSIADDIFNENAQHLPSKLPILQETQKERSNCINKSTSQNNIVNKIEKKNVEQFCVEFNSEKLLINIEKVSSHDDNNNNDNSTKDSSLSLDIINNNNCVEFNNKSNSLMENYEKIDDIHNKRKLSNRKQLMPKKIERTSNGLIKIAPRPENMPTDYGRNDHNTLLTMKKNTPKKKYNCHLCSKVFGWSTDLKRHILVHTGERPFKCTKCSACFTRNFLLQKHKSKIHPCNNKETIERNKLLEEKVNENLKQLKNEMCQLENKSNCIKEEIMEEEIEGGRENHEDQQQIDNNNYFEEEMMVFEESKLGIKEELLDPLGDTDSSPDNNQRFVNGNWILTENSNISNNQIKGNNKLLELEYEHKEILMVSPVIKMSS